MLAEECDELKIQLWKLSLRVEDLEGAETYDHDEISQDINLVERSISARVDSLYFDFTKRIERVETILSDIHNVLARGL